MKTQLGSTNKNIKNKGKTTIDNKSNNAKKDKNKRKRDKKNIINNQTK